MHYTECPNKPSVVFSKAKGRSGFLITIFFLIKYNKARVIIN